MTKTKILKSQIAKGIKVEMEHTKSRVLARKIAIDHLHENPNYYKKVKFGKGYMEYLVSVKKPKHYEKDDD